ncbi:MAG: response regulator transcription factor [Flavobacteriales bacterium]|jgi:two-component system, NarL family, invasion response regulator UvrY|nr:response regulator transcription factor [Flavobacteriales bacterium]
MSKKYTVHIADDHQIIIDGIGAVVNLEDDLEVVGSSLNGKETVKWFKENYADVLLLDINMPICNGKEVLKQLKEIDDRPDVIVLTSYDDVKTIKDVLDLGAKGFLPKKTAGVNVAEAIRTVLSGEEYFTPDVNKKIMHSLLGKPLKEEGIDNPEIVESLSKREFQILKMIAQEYSTKEIAKNLFISTRTVEAHRNELYEKTGSKNVIGLVNFASKNNVI